MAETSPKQQRTKKGKSNKGKPKKTKTKTPGKYVVDVYIDYDDASTFTPECSFRIPSARNLIVLLEKGKKYFGFKIVAREVERSEPVEDEKVGKIQRTKEAGTIGGSLKVPAQGLLKYLQDTFGPEGRKEHSFGENVDISVFTSARRDTTLPGGKEVYSLSFSVGRPSSSKGKRTEERPKKKESPSEPKQPREKRVRKTPTKEEAKERLEKEEDKLRKLKTELAGKEGKDATKLRKSIKQKEEYIAELRAIADGERAGAKASRDSADANLAAYF
jgi:hypothetical protein